MKDPTDATADIISVIAASLFFAGCFGYVAIMLSIAFAR